MKCVISIRVSPARIVVDVRSTPSFRLTRSATVVPVCCWRGRTLVAVQVGARALGIGGLRISQHHSTKLRRHLLQQLLQEWHLPIELDAHTVDRLFKEMYATEGYELKVDLETQVVETPSGEGDQFEVDAFRKHCLLNGLDDIALTLESADAIRAFEQNWRKQSPWLFDAIG